MNLRVNGGLRVVMVVLSAARNEPLRCGTLVPGEAVLVEGRTVSIWEISLSGQWFHELKVIPKSPFHFKRKINEINKNELKVEHCIQFKHVDTLNSLSNQLFNIRKEGVANQAPSVP